MIYPDFIIPFVSIFLAELGDKTQLALLVLSARTSKPWSLAFGAILAFAIVDGIAVLTGSWIASMVPSFWIQLVSAVLFILFGVLMLKSDKEGGGDQTDSIRRPWLAGFLLILVSEWGDKTQLASAVFAARYSGAAVFAGVVGALAVLSILTAFAGRWIAARIPARVTSKVAAGLFILIGIVFFFFMIRSYFNTR